MLTETDANILKTIPDKATFTFHEATTAPSEGEEFVVSHYRFLNFKRNKILCRR